MRRFQVHVNVSNDDDAIKLRLEFMSLVQHVTETTHEHGNTLDLLSLVPRMTLQLLPRTSACFSLIML